MGTGARTQSRFGGTCRPRYGLYTTAFGPYRRVQVLHDGAWCDGWLTAHRRDAYGWLGMVRFVVAVGRMHWHCKHESALGSGHRR